MIVVRGYFEVANGGTIFLDEVAELPLSTQVRLLRVLETGEFLRVGSSKIIKTNVRVIAATNVDIQKAIQQGKFREDLFYRLNTVPVNIPPLRERKEDIHLLFRKFAV
jgi:transcriptional regulator with PAS, ATPase and Fis domain